MDFQRGMYWKMSFPGLTFEWRTTSHLHTYIYTHWFRRITSWCLARKNRWKPWRTMCIFWVKGIRSSHSSTTFLRSHVVAVGINHTIGRFFRMKHMQMYIYVNLNISCFMNLILGQPRCEIVEQIFGIFDIKKVDHASKTRCTSWCQRWGRAEKHVAHQLIHRVSLEVVTLRQSASSILWRWHSWRRRRRKLGWMDLHVLFLDGEQCLPRAYIPDVYWCMWSSLCVVVWLLLVCARFPWTYWGTRACDKWHQAGIRIVSARAESVLRVGFSKSARLIPFSTPCTRTSLLGSRHVPKNVLHLKLQQSLRNHRPNEARPKQVEKHVSCGFFVAAVKLLSFWRRNRWLCERYCTIFFRPGFFDVWFLAWKTKGVNWILFGHSQLILAQVKLTPAQRHGNLTA